jgi:hypothetical protein
MTISVVLRLAEQALATGRLAGEAHLVASGETAEIRSAEELVAFARGGGGGARGAADPDETEEGT